MSTIHDELRRAQQFRHGDSVVAGLRIKGQISGNEDLVVEGTVEGPIQLAGCTLTVGENGKVTGDIAAREVVVYGSLTGNVLASERVQIKASGSIVGDIGTARKISTDFDGASEMSAVIKGSFSWPPIPSV